ncbi:MAG TPA: TetR/AcrR family transcriptional regulator [Enterobacteriaceae bacterium]|nr:TetR/AcrR family transcriptional regulator [Enterobacteriaceae bacterium]
MTQTRRQAILDTAIALFRQKGLPQTATRDVTETLGISRSHIYHYFPNWQALCLAALDHFLKTDLQSAEEELQDMPAREALSLLIEWFLPHRIDPDWLLYSDIWQASMRDEAWKKLTLEHTAGWNGQFQKVIQQGIDEGIFQPLDAARTARQLCALVNGYADLLSLDPDPVLRAQAIEDIDQMVRLISTH